MPQSAQFFLAVGGILAIGMATDMLGQRTFLPRVSLLVIVGVLVGPAALNLIPTPLLDDFDIISMMALVIIGFLLGGKLTRDSLISSGNTGLLVSLSAAVGTTIIVFSGLYLLDVPIDIALLLACIAAATAPAATFDIVMESQSSSRFASLLLMVVALDDIWGLILFSFALAAAGVINGNGSGISPLFMVAQDIGGGVLIGLLLGLPAAFLTGRIKPGQPMLTEALVLTFLCGGLAIWADSSFLIASMVMGATIANMARHHEYPFHAIENIERPFLIIFFVLAGASLELNALLATGSIGLAYISLRSLGKIMGARAGTAIAGTDTATGRWMGLALLPQAGVAVGMALVASTAFPEYRDVLLPIVIGATVVFEILGPIGTRLALTATKD